MNIPQDKIESTVDAFSKELDGDIFDFVNDALSGMQDKVGIKIGDCCPSVACPMMTKQEELRDSMLAVIKHQLYAKLSDEE